MADKTVRIEVELTDEEAWQFALFLKRSDFEMFRGVTDAWMSMEERKAAAYRMVDAVEKIRRALDEAGYGPR